MFQMSGRNPLWAYLHGRSCRFQIQRKAQGQWDVRTLSLGAQSEPCSHLAAPVRGRSGQEPTTMQQEATARWESSDDVTQTFLPPASKVETATRFAPAVSTR